MSLFRQHKPQNLSEWLETATLGIEATAQARIHAEIEAHYAEAVAFRIENGSLENAAQAAALADLGDAKAAGQRFRKEHLTKKEAKSATRSMDLARSSNAIYGFFLLLCAVTAAAYLITTSSHFWDANQLSLRLLVVMGLLQFVLLLLVRIAAYVLSRQKSPEEAKGKVLLMDFLTSLIMGFWFLGVIIDRLVSPSNSGDSLGFSMLMLGINIMLFFQNLLRGLYCLRIRKKLRLAGDDGCTHA